MANSVADTNKPLGNFLRQFRDKHSQEWTELSAQQFMSIWNHYDADGNGYIEGSELDKFLREFVRSIVNDETLLESDEILSDSALNELKNEIMSAYDDNKDNRIEIGELSQMLPTEENFLLLFRRNNPVKSSIEFMNIWKKFDKNHTGYIERHELNEFLSCLLNDNGKLSGISEEKLGEYEKTILELFDVNGDGKLQLSEMGRLIPVKENFLRRPLFQNSAKLTNYEIDRIFRKYDQDKSDNIENDELDGLCKDLLDLTMAEYGEENLIDLRNALLEQCDVDNDGKISRDELQLILLQHSRKFHQGK